MNVVILYLKNNNIIHDFYENVISINKNKIEFISGYVEGFNEDEIGYVVTDELTFNTTIVENNKLIELDNGEVETIKLPLIIDKWLEDSQDNIFKQGDTLPSDLINISHQFIKPSQEEIMSQYQLLKEKVAMQDTVIEDLMFNIIPELIGGGI